MKVGKDHAILESGKTGENLYSGWMTGYAYQACRNLYFNIGLHELTPERRRILLGWLVTYTDMVQTLESGGAGNLDKGLKIMFENVSSSKSGTLLGHHPATTSDIDNPLERSEAEATLFDDWFAELQGVMRAKVPYAYNASRFASASSELSQNQEGPVSNHCLDELRDSLLRMKTILPQGVYEVIRHDISKLEASWPPRRSQTLSRRERLTPSEERLESSTGPAWRSTRTWSDLVLGSITVRDCLNKVGRAAYYIAIGAVGLALFSLVGLAIASPFIVVPAILHTPLDSLTLASGQDLFNVVETVVSTLAAAGLSLSLLARKAWAGMLAFEPWMAVKLAKRNWARNDGGL